MATTRELSLIQGFKDKINTFKGGKTCVTVAEHTREVNGIEYIIPEHERCIKGSKARDAAALRGEEVGFENLRKAERNAILVQAIREIEAYDYSEIRKQAIEGLRNVGEIMVVGENGELATHEQVEQRLVDDMNRVIAATGFEFIPKSDSLKVPIDASKFGEDLNIDIGKLQDFYNKRLIYTITDQLKTGCSTDPLTGIEICDLHGGIGFNATKLHEDFGWASISEQAAEGIWDSARELYLKDPSKFPDGYVDIGVIKMGLGAINSNEAMYRVLRSRMDVLLTKEQRDLGFAFVKERSEDEEFSKEYTEAAKDLINKSSDQEDPMFYLLDNIKSIPASNRKPIGDSLFVGSTSNTIKNSSSSSKGIRGAIFGKSTPEETLIFKRDSINLVLDEESIRDVPLRHIVAVHKIKVAHEDGTLLTKEEAVRPSFHPNYPFGVTGKRGVILEESQHISNFLPQALTNQFFHATTESVKHDSDVVSFANSPTTLPGTKAFAGKMVRENFTETSLLSAYMQLAFPNTRLVDNEDEWNNLINDEDFNLSEFDGEVTHGVLERDGTIYLNPSLMDDSIPSRGLAHVWIDHIESANNELYTRGMELVAGTKEHKSAIKRLTSKISNKSILDKKAREEALSEVISSKIKRLQGISKKSSGHWLRNLSTYIREVFPSQFSRDESFEEDEVTYQDFLLGAVGEIFQGTPVYISEVKGIRAKLTEEEKEIIRERISR